MHKPELQCMIPRVATHERMEMKPITLRQRQVHLDFHTGPAIPDVGIEAMRAMRFYDR